MSAVGKSAVLSDVGMVRLPQHRSSDASLVVMQGPDGAVPFSIARIFVVRAGAGARRGRHAHKQCNQLMVCMHGKCEVTSDDGSQRRLDVLDRIDVGLLVPAGIWCEQHYMSDGTLLMVTCDRPYEENDYIRDYDSYVAYRARMSGKQ
jgi:hypothetical protein